MDVGRAPGTLPRATYRLQFGPDFTFEAAGEVVAYLAALGISHVYASPLTAARPGSTHGYDTVDHGRVSPEIGGRGGLDAFVRVLHGHGMGLILDFVPNHMGIGPDNEWWMDVLEWGRASLRARYFDIDWHPPGAGLAGRVLLPVLGDHYGTVLERGELTVGFDRETGSLRVRYHDQRFPLAPRDYPGILRSAAARRGVESERLQALASAMEGALSVRSPAERRNRVAEVKARLADEVSDRPVELAALEEALQELNGEDGVPESLDPLDRLLDRQAYRLAFWRVAAFEINYRRFFDIDDLAGLRMEEPELFEKGHRLVRDLAERGALQGIRLDHVDGLRDPRAYFERLRRLAVEAGVPDLLVLVEKILAPHERLRSDWPVDGTTGYEFMADVDGVFVDPAGERPLERAYTRFVGAETTFPEVALEAKRLIMRETLASELNVLANLFHRLARQSRITRDFTLTGFRTALADVVAHFRVYRTYVRAGDGGRGDRGGRGRKREVAPEDRAEIDQAVGRAQRRSRQPDRSIYDFVRDVLTLDLLDDPRRGYRPADVVDAALRFQQYTGPVMAKSVEDTAFYRYHRLVALNEVGGEPEHFGISPGDFHRKNARRATDAPRSMIATATHDHKRGEDVRARLAVLSELPREWARRVRRWSRSNRPWRAQIEGRATPAASDEYLLYQILVGAWPLALEPADVEGLAAFRERVAAYMLKAAREGKERTSWIAPDEEYEAALAAFVGGVLDPESHELLEDLHGFVERIAPAAAVNGLARTAVKLASPGVPDTYQGTELWDFSLVDPDNRRPVDYAARREALASEDGWDELLRSWRDGRVKQRVIAHAMEARRSDPDLFSRGRYLPVEAQGRHRRRVLSFARELEGRLLVVVAPRLVLPLMAEDAVPLPRGWGGLDLAFAPDLLPEGTRVLRDAFTGDEVQVSADGRVSVERALGRLPVAFLLARRGQDG